MYSVVLRGEAQIPTKAATKGTPRALNASQPSTPVTLTVLPKQLAMLTIQPATSKAKPGDSAAVVVKVARMHDFAGAFQVELVAPPEAKGIEAEPATIPAGKDEATLTLRVAAGAAKGARTGLVVRATGLFLGRAAVVQEAKLPLDVTR